MPDTAPDPMVEGLEKLLRMKPLDGFDFERWAQIRRDCTKLLKDYGSQIREFGWTVSDVFGYDPKCPYHGSGLGLYLRGGKITRFRPRDVLVWAPNGGGGKWSRKSGWATPREKPPIWEGADVDGPVWHRPRNLPVPSPVAAQLAPVPEPVEVPMLVMPPHVFAAFTGPSCAIH